MRSKTLCALITATASCLPVQQEKPTMLIVDIGPAHDSMVQEGISIEEPSKSYSQLSHQILNGLFSNPGSSNHRYSFRNQQFKIITYYGAFNDDKEVLQYFIVDTITNAMIHFLDDQPYGSVDGWYRCLRRGNPPADDTFKCGMMGRKDPQVKQLFLDTVELVHAQLQYQKTSLDEKYRKGYADLLYGDHGQPLAWELHTLP